MGKGLRVALGIVAGVLAVWLVTVVVIRLENPPEQEAREDREAQRTDQHNRRSEWEWFRHNRDDYERDLAIYNANPRGEKPIAPLPPTFPDPSGIGEGRE